MSGPLGGLRVVDCSLGTAGPQATGLLADYGADVIWVEPRGGDPARRSDPGAASVFNRGKRSVELDVHDQAERQRLLELIDRADVFVESWAPGVADDLGLGYAALRARNPALIYCSISGFGTEGPHRDLPGYESLVHALYGTMAQQAGHREGPIFQALPFGSTGAAQLAVIGVLAAIHRRLEDGSGRQVETSLLDGALTFHSMLWGESEASLAAAGQTQPSSNTMRGPVKQRLITRSFLCGDGEYIGIHTAAVGAFSRLMDVLGLSDRIPPTANGVDIGTPLTPEQAEVLEDNIHTIFAAHPRTYWIQRLLEADVCAVEHQPPTVVFDHAQAQHNQMVVKVDDPVLGPVEQVAPGIRLNGAAPPAPKPAPRPGADTQAVWAELAQPAAPSRWRKAGASGKPDPRPLLDGVKVLDLGAYYAGPYSSRLLADLGAQVIKLEPTFGDQLRGIERPFFSAQAGKRGIAANLKDPDLARAAKALINWADIIHHNMRPGAAERLGLAAEQVKAVNPNAIYLYAPGWGASGPHRMRQSFAPMLSAFVGGSYEVAGQYNEPLPSVGNEDPGNGLLGAIGMLIALLHRELSGEALYCENPQLNAAMGMVAHIVRKPDGEAVGAARLDVLQRGVGALESLYATSDGWVCLAARTDAEIAQLEAKLDVSILSQPQFASVEARAENRDELQDLLGEAFAKRSTVEAVKLFEGSKVAVVEPAGASRVHEFMNDPLQRRVRRVAEVRHADKGLVREMDQLIRISDAEVTPHRLAPGLGEHSDEILAWIGYTPEEIAGLRGRGAVR